MAVITSWILAGWNIRYGRWWMFQWAGCIGPVNFGIHVDFRRRRTGREGLRYGPYADLHLPFCILSLGVNPAYSGELDLLVSSSRGGIDGNR